MSEKNKKIIIVDDNTAILDSLQMMLDLEGYNVELFEKGSEMYQQLDKDNLPNLILMDMWLAGEDGRDICRLIRGNTDLDGLPVIIMSASRGLAKSAIDSGADEFVAKPFDLFEVLEKIKKYCN
ncbi:response regulator [Soonwooa sp.]|uniref:response regulator transcription factor n=1 Tax=Soonwooa sp. TaxID=1938592 RepID=UPI00260A0C74|nr:response regulator [Soonwooa sp.]